MPNPAGRAAITTTVARRLPACNSPLRRPIFLLQLFAQSSDGLAKAEKSMQDAAKASSEAHCRSSGRCICGVQDRSSRALL